jgi:hypothetical protein
MPDVHGSACLSLRTTDGYGLCCFWWEICQSVQRLQYLSEQLQDQLADSQAELVTYKAQTAAAAATSQVATQVNSSGLSDAASGMDATNPSEVSSLADDITFRPSPVAARAATQPPKADPQLPMYAVLCEPTSCAQAGVQPSTAVEQQLVAEQQQQADDAVKSAAAAAAAAQAEVQRLQAELEVSLTARGHLAEQVDQQRVIEATRQAVVCDLRARLAVEQKHVEAQEQEADHLQHAVVMLHEQQLQLQHLLPGGGPPETASALPSLNKHEQQQLWQRQQPWPCQLQVRVAELEGLVLELQDELEAKAEALRQTIQQQELRAGAGYARTEEVGGSLSLG